MPRTEWFRPGDSFFMAGLLDVDTIGVIREKNVPCLRRSEKKRVDSLGLAEFLYSGKK